MLLAIALGILELSSTPGYDRLFCESSLVYMALSPPILLYWQILEVETVGNEATIPGTCVKQSQGVKRVFTSHTASDQNWS